MPRQNRRAIRSLWTDLASVTLLQIAFFFPFAHKNPSAQGQRDLLLFQQLPRPASHHLLDELQPLGRQVVSGVPFKTEGQQMPQGGPMLLGHDLSRCFKEIIIHTGNHRFGISLQVFQRCQCIPASEVEQGVAVVEQGRGRVDLIRPIVHQEAEVSEMPVRIADHGIEYQHIMERRDILLAQAPVIGCHGVHAASYYPADGDVGILLAGKQLAGGAEIALPLGQAVFNGIDAHGLGDLGGVELGIGLVSGVVGSGGAALVEQDLSVFPAPALGEHAVGGELRAGRKGGPDAAAVAGKGDQRQDLTEAVLVEIVFGKCPLKSLFHDPIAVIQGQALGHLDNAQRTIQIQTALAEEIVDKRPVLGDRPMLQPLKQAVPIRLQIQRKQVPLLFVDPCDIQFRSISAVNGFKPQQRRIKMAQLIGHLIFLLLRFL